MSIKTAIFRRFSLILESVFNLKVSKPYDIMLAEANYKKQ
jgi:hypothetical protein